MAVANDRQTRNFISCTTFGASMKSVSLCCLLLLEDFLLLRSPPNAAEECWCCCCCYQKRYTYLHMVVLWCMLWWWWWCVCDGAEASPNAAGRRRVSAEILLQATRLMGFLTLVVSTWVCVPSNWLFPG